MSRKPRIYYTETDKALMWDRWRKGDSLENIAQLFGRTHSSVAVILRRTGGIRPPKRTRSRRALSIAEREEISRGVVAGRSLRSIAASLSRAPSTVSREINSNGGRQHYRANLADEAAWTPISKCTSAILKVLGSVAPTRTRTACSDSTSRGEWISRTSIKTD
jgi:IS30 family transposase